MPNNEMKRTAQGGGIEGDLDDRIVPSGSYRDALNINSSRSEGSDVGAVESLPGNIELAGQSGISGQVIGQKREGNKIYWFVEDTGKDAIYEYDVITKVVSIVLTDNSLNDDAPVIEEDDFTASYSLDVTGITGSNFVFGNAPADQTGDASDSYSFTDQVLTASPGFEFDSPPVFAGDSLTGTFVDANVMVERTATGTISSSPEEFTFSDAGVQFTITNLGIVSLSATVGAITAATFTDTQDLSPVATATLRVNAVSVRVPNTPLIYSNANVIVMGTVSSTQPSSNLNDFAFSDITVTCSVDTSGNVSIDASPGNIALAAGQLSNYGTVTSDTPRVISVVTSGTVPTGFLDVGDAYSFNDTCNATQPSFSVPVFSFANTGSSGSVDTQTGDITINTGAGYSISLASGQTSSYGTVTTPTFRSISVVATGTVPTGFTESGNPFSLPGTVSTTQGAVTVGAFTEGNWTGSVSVSPTGQVLINNGNVGSVTTVPPSFSANSGDSDVPRTLVVTLMNIPAGFSNTGGNISFNRTVQQPSNLPTFNASDWTGVVNVSQTGNITSTVGNAGPISIQTNSFPDNTGTTPITRSVTVQVTIPSGFAMFGSTKNLIRSASQPGINVQSFSNTVTLVDNVVGATVNTGSVTLTANAGQGDSATFTIVADTDFTVDATDINASSSNVTLASALFANDAFGLGTVVGSVSGTVGSSDQSVTITISGSATFTGQTPLSSGAITRTDGGGSSFNVNQQVSLQVSPSGGSGTYTYAWTIAGTASLTGSLTNRTVSFNAGGIGGGGQVTCTVNSVGFTEDDASFTYFVTTF